MNQQIELLRQKVELQRDLAGAEIELENALAAQAELDRRAAQAQVVANAEADMATLQETYEDGLAESNQAFAELVVEFSAWVSDRAELARLADAMLKAAHAITARDVYQQPGVDPQSPPGLIRETHQGLARTHLIELGVIPSLVYRGEASPGAIALMQAANNAGGGTMISLPPVTAAMI